MAIIVMDVETETNFVLLGTGYGSWATEKPGTFLAPDRKSGQDLVAYICDADGDILMKWPGDLVVVSVDGRPPAELLSPRPPGAELS